MISEATGIPKEHVHGFVVGFTANMVSVVIVALLVWYWKEAKKS